MTTRKFDLHAARVRFRLALVPRYDNALKTRSLTCKWLEYYRIEIKALAEGAKGLVTNELETYYGATIGNIEVAEPRAIQTEPYGLRVRVVNPDAAIRDASVNLLAPKKTLKGKLDVQVPPVEAGGGAWVTFQVKPLVAGAIPLTLELRQNGLLIDRRPYTLRCNPKLVFLGLSPETSRVAGEGESLTLKGSIRNGGKSPARGVNCFFFY